MDVEGICCVDLVVDVGSGLHVVGESGVGAGGVAEGEEGGDIGGEAVAGEGAHEGENLCGRDGGGDGFVGWVGRDEFAAHHYGACCTVWMG